MHTYSQKVGGPRSTSEATLFHQAQAGCQDSLAALMTRHDGLVQAVVRRQVLGQMPFFEALQAGRGGLWRAILGYDPSRGLAFSTYAWTCIMRHVWRAVKAHARFHSVLVTSDELPPIEEQDPAVTWEATVVRQTVHHLVQRLPERLRAVVVARYGLDGRAPAIYRQIGVTLGSAASELANFTPRPSSGCATQPTPRPYAVSWAATLSPTISLLMTWRSAGCSGEEGDVAANLTAVESRAQDATFVAQCSLPGLQDRLPLRWIVPPETPPSPKRAYRSHYVYLGGWQDLQDATARKHLSPFDLILRLVDFTPLRPVLAQLLGWTSARGRVPFDPISIFLLNGWQVTNRWPRAETLRNLCNPTNAEYARRFGFENGLFPTEGGLRHWLTALGQNSTNGETILVDEEQHIEIAIERLNQLLAQSVFLLVKNGFLSQEAWEKALICPDGMIHDAASRMRCASVRETCYQPVSPDTPRPCPAKEKERRGCDCDTITCASACRYATSRDPEARFVWYSGSNHSTDNPNQSTNPAQTKKKRGKGRYGYRSLPIQLADPLRRFSVVLLDAFLPANQREENVAAALLLQLHANYPNLSVDTVAGDAGFGYERVLQVIYRDLHARRAIDLRADKSDRDKPYWLIRGYDDKGRPICPYGYALKANGFDFGRRRHKWLCAHSCRNGATPAVYIEGTIYPPEECPYLDHPHGQIINVGERFKNNSIRLVRDIPVGTRAWQRLYHRARNAVEGRNAAFQAWGLKRLPLYGNPRNKALIFQADVWLNLSTMARLVLEATAATSST